MATFTDPYSLLLYLVWYAVFASAPMEDTLLQDATAVPVFLISRRVKMFGKFTTIFSPTRKKYPEFRYHVLQSFLFVIDLAYLLTTPQERMICISDQSALAQMANTSLQERRTS